MKIQSVSRRLQPPWSGKRYVGQIDQADVAFIQLHWARSLAIGNANMDRSQAYRCEFAHSAKADFLTSRHSEDFHAHANLTLTISRTVYSPVDCGRDIVR